MPGYLSIHGDILVLDNYEADYGCFPVTWKDGILPEKVLGDYTSSSRPCLRIRDFEKYMKLPVGYATALHLPREPEDSCTSSAFSQLHQLYFTAHQGDLMLYERKPMSFGEKR